MQTEPGFVTSKLLKAHNLVAFMKEIYVSLETNLGGGKREL